VRVRTVRLLGSGFLRLVEIMPDLRQNACSARQGLNRHNYLFQRPQKGGPKADQFPGSERGKGGGGVGHLRALGYYNLRARPHLPHQSSYAPTTTRSPPSLSNLASAIDLPSPTIISSPCVWIELETRTFGTSGTQLPEYWKPSCPCTR
jgi:hypothetical protein